MTVQIQDSSFSMKESIPVWNWNGYNSRWVEQCSNRQEVIENALAYAEQKGDEVESVISDDGENITIVVTTAYEFYGWRGSVQIFTDTPGAVQSDPENQDDMWWQPA